MNQIAINQQTNLHRVGSETEDVWKSTNHIGRRSVPMEVENATSGAIAATAAAAATSILSLFGIEFLKVTSIFYNK